MTEEVAWFRVEAGSADGTARIVLVDPARDSLTCPAHGETRLHCLQRAFSGLAEEVYPSVNIGS